MKLIKKDDHNLFCLTAGIYVPVYTVTRPRYENSPYGQFMVNYITILVFKLSPCSKCNLLLFG